MKKVGNINLPVFAKSPFTPTTTERVSEHLSQSQCEELWKETTRGNIELRKKDKNK